MEKDELETSSPRQQLEQAYEERLVLMNQYEHADPELTKCIAYRILSVDALIEILHNKLTSEVTTVNTESSAWERFTRLFLKRLIRKPKKYIKTIEKEPDIIKEMYISKMLGTVKSD